MFALNEIALKNYLSLIKFSHTIFALPFALIGFTLSINQDEHNFSWYKLLFVILCMVFARSAAMAFNRYIDRDIDTANPRTAKIREIPNGTIKANVTKGQSSDFQLVSPTSVAAVKGTDFWGVINENTGDKFCGLSGKVEVTNSATGQMVELLANTTALSLKNGSLSVATTQEGDVPADQDPGEDENGEKEIRIPFQNEAGEQKELIIKIKNN